MSKDIDMPWCERCQCWHHESAGHVHMSENMSWLDYILLKPDDTARRKRYFRRFCGVMIVAGLLWLWIKGYNCPC